MEKSIDDAAQPRFWHLYWQAAPGRSLLYTPRLIEQVKTRLTRAHPAADSELIYYLLLHQELYYLLLHQELHLVSRLPDGAPLKTFCSGVAHVVARRVRQSQGGFGPVFASRYKARRIEGVQALGEVIRMLAWRPVATGARETPTHFQHSPLRAILGLALADGFNSAAALTYFGTSVPLAREAIRRLLANRPSKLEILHWELAHGLALARGVSTQVGALELRVHGAAAVLVAASDPPGIDGALTLLELWVREALRRSTGQRLSTLSGADAARGRALVARLAEKLGLCSSAYVARRFDRSKSTLSEQVSKSRLCAEDRAMLSAPIDQIVQQAIALAMHAAEGGVVHHVSR